MAKCQKTSQKFVLYLDLVIILGDSYYRYSDMVRPLVELTKKDVPGTMESRM
jgi:hypothetical protein